MRAAQRTRGPQSLGPALKNCASERLLYDNVKILCYLKYTRHVNSNYS